MLRIVIALTLLISAISLTGCTYNQGTCMTSSCGYVATTTYVPATTYVKKTTYVPVMNYNTRTCCSTCDRCNSNYDGTYYSDYYGTYNTGWY